jgi:ribosome-binding factor A
MAKVAEAVREIVSTVVLFELKDPRVTNVTVLRAEVSPDLRNAKVYVSVMGDEKTQSLTLHGLNSARGFIQSKIADRLETRYVPVLTFVTDLGVKLSAQASATIREALSRSPADVPPPDERSPADQFAHGMEADAAVGEADASVDDSGVVEGPEDDDA